MNRAFATLLLIGALVPACGDDDDDTGPNDGGAPSGGRAGSGGISSGGSPGGGEAAGGAPSEQAERLVELVATEYHFNPSIIHARPGERLIIAVRNAGATAHSIELELPSGDVELEEEVAIGVTSEIEVTAPTAAGEYTFYCPISNHRSLGMEGTLVVAEPPAVALESVADGLVSPVAMAVAPDDERLFVVDQAGMIRIIENGELLEEPFLDLSDKLVELEPMYDERGLLGLAFHPDYANNGRFFVYYSAPLSATGPDGWDHTNVLSEYVVSTGDANLADADSERVLLELDHPQGNHNGGTLAFGPDGFLYLSIGDGGGAGDIDEGHTPDLGNGQDTTQLHGKILRLDVDAVVTEPYAIPADNPFVGTDSAEEIFAYGFRNPYRFSFDLGGDEALYVGDAGQGRWEEVSRVELGGNYGWNILEGTHCFDASDFANPLASCASTGAADEDLLWPVIEVPNSEMAGGVGTAVVGGYVYRGTELGELDGRYVFGVFSKGEDSPSGQLFVASDEDDTGEDLWAVEHLAVSDAADGTLPYLLKGFGQDIAGEIYVLVSTEAGPTGTSGEVVKLTAP